MNSYACILFIAAATLAPVAVHAQPPHPPSGAIASIARGELPQTVTGRITRLDPRSGTFSLREGDNGKVVDLTARKDLVAGLRRGDRVTVTYEGNTATKIQATSEK